jgi:hypothetical protein
VNILEVPKKGALTNRNDLPDRINHWSRAARQPPPLPPRALPVIYKETTSGDIQDKTASTSLKSPQATEDEKSCRYTEYTSMSYHDGWFPESSTTQDVNPRSYGDRDENKIQVQAENGAKQYLAPEHKDRSRRSSRVYVGHTRKKDGTGTPSRSSQRSTRRSRSSISSSAHATMNYPPIDKRSMRERLHKVILTLKSPRTNKALTGLKETHTIL